MALTEMSNWPSLFHIAPNNTPYTYRLNLPVFFYVRNDKRKWRRLRVGLEHPPREENQDHDSCSQNSAHLVLEFINKGTNHAQNCEPLKLAAIVAFVFI